TSTGLSPRAVMSEGKAPLSLVNTDPVAGLKSPPDRLTNPGLLVVSAVRPPRPAPLNFEPTKVLPECPPQFGLARSQAVLVQLFWKLALPCHQKMLNGAALAPAVAPFA